jgi:hypothetical protein
MLPSTPQRSVPPVFGCAAAAVVLLAVLVATGLLAAE